SSPPFSPASARTASSCGAGPLPLFESSAVIAIEVTPRGRKVKRRARDAVSRRREADAGVALAQPVDEGNGEKHHPHLADDLAGEEVEAAEGELQEDGAVDDETDDARQHDRRDE